MTGHERKDGSDAKAKEREAPNPDAEAPSRAGQLHEGSAHPVGNQGAPGGTSDDDGDSENQQDPSRRSNAPGRD